MTPTEIIEAFNLVEDTEDSRWKGTAKHVWRGSRGGHGVRFADPTGDWSRYDDALEADVWDPGQPDRPGWQYIEGWIDGPYRVVWVDFAQRAVFTYCEGDLVLATFDDAHAFRMELAAAEGYYGEPVPRSYTVGPGGVREYDRESAYYWPPATA